VPRIVEEQPYNGALEKVERLGLGPLLDEIRGVLRGFTLRVREERDANGGAAVRKLIDERFQRATGWTKKQTGDVDWTKCLIVNGTRACIGVEIQFSARSDLVVVDLIHLRKALTEGKIDVAVLVVPSDRLGVFLTDRGPKIADAKRHVREARADDLPLLLVALEHDGPGPALAKQAKGRGTRP
jgi:hypothetical protein